MPLALPPRPARVRSTAGRLLALSLAAVLAAAAAAAPAAAQGTAAPNPDPRVGLSAGRFDAAEATWNMRVLSRNRPAPEFAGSTSSDLAFTGKYAIQGNYNGWMVWDISNPREPALVRGFVCPASQSDVSVYGNLLFVSGEGLTGRLDCGTQGVQDTVSQERLRGLRIFDISDIRNPRNVGNVQTCRGSHTHTVLAHPGDPENVYVYISGSAGVRSPRELPGCVAETPDRDPNSALFRIEVVKVPLANPERAAIVSSPRIFKDLTAPPRHGDTPADIEAARARGGFVVTVDGQERVINQGFVNVVLDSIVRARGGAGRAEATAADTAAVRAALPGIVQEALGGDRGPRPGPTQCHDITVYPAIGLAGGACEGYGMLLDIRDPVNPVRIAAVADSNFSYWHSATFNNDGTKVLFSDEWGGGGQPKCRATDPAEWGANAIFAITPGKEMEFRSYYKLPAPQTVFENCVAHNGSLIPIPGRDVMVQAWYQGGVSVFDWTDAANPYEIAFFDRGPADSTRQAPGGSWSAYWYNGVIVSSEISRGLDVLELTPSAHLSQNEIDAANTVRLDHLNPQGQPRFVWPPSFALARAYLDQLERSNGLAAARIATVRAALTAAERATGAQRSRALGQLAAQLHRDANGAADAPKVHALAGAVERLAAASR
ncbi:MAG: hypothetical protein KY467_16295 [Gemmatimonadetes bacterium]|nr:hypothetical protein [Gemmatimonadota bacterium]